MYINVLNIANITGIKIYIIITISTHNVCITGLDGAVAKSSAKGLRSIGFVSRYGLQSRMGF